MNRQRPLITFFFLLFSGAVCSQTYTEPQFKGGRKALSAYMSGYVSMPTADLEAGTEPRVTADIYISKDGRVKFINVTGGRPELRIQVKRCLTLMPDWMPGRLNNIAVDTVVAQRIYFSFNRSRRTQDTTVCEIITYFLPAPPPEKDARKAKKDLAAAKHFTDSLYNKGLEASTTNDFPEAIRLFNEVKERCVPGANLFYNLGVVYLKSGNKGLACDSFREAAKKGDDEAYKLYLKVCK